VPYHRAPRRRGVGEGFLAGMGVFGGLIFVVVVVVFVFVFVFIFVFVFVAAAATAAVVVTGAAAVVVAARGLFVALEVSRCHPIGSANMGGGRGNGGLADTGTLRRGNGYATSLERGLGPVVIDSQP
jgi:hypothetical protein